MSEKEFKEGFIKCKVKTVTGQELCNEIGSLKNWSDGYIAFSSDEMRKSAFETDVLKNKALSDIIDEKPLGEKYGYIMEINLWENSGNESEEISFEREGKDFLCQHWKLVLTLPTGSNDTNYHNCYHREVKLQPRDNTKLYKGRHFISHEVIIPSRRLHIFITAGVK